jgi:hypothetical protein
MALSARGISDFVRFDRVEGLALGGGLTQRLGAGLSIAGRARYGFDDREAKWQGRLEWQNASGVSVGAFVQRDFREIEEEPERSRALNSIAAQEFGSDYTDPYGVEGYGIALQHAPPGEALWRLEAAFDEPFTLTPRATPVTGRFLGLVDVPATRYVRVVLRRERPTSLSFLGTELRTALEIRSLGSTSNITPLCPVPASCPSSFVTVRGAFMVDLERPIGSQRLVLHTVGGAVGARRDSPPAQELFYFGGPVSGAGYDFHQLLGRAGWSQRVEWRSPIPFFAIPLGRFGKIPSAATLAPYTQVVAIGGAPVGVSRNGVPLAPTVAGAYPAVGLGLLTFFDLVRFDVSRGLRGGRWLFSFDVNPEFWSVL